MNAKRKNIISTKRHRLEDVLPLEFPYSLMLDPCNLCNFKCKFCALQSSEEKQSFHKQFMEWELFKKIIDDISRFPVRLKVLRVSGQGEPFLNPNFIEMISYAKEKQVADFIETVTNGSKLCPEFNAKLVGSGIDRIRISIESVSEEGYRNIAGCKINFNKFIENIKDLHDKSNGKCEIYIKIVDAAVDTEEKRELFYDIFGNICDRIWIDQVIPLWSDFDEINNSFCIQEKGVHGQALQAVKVCPFSFYNLLINPDGDVTVCCADWKRKLVLGNLNIQTFDEIWNGELLRNFWIDMLKGDKNKYEMCSKCLLPMYDCNDNIDEFAEVILERLANS